MHTYTYTNTHTTNTCTHIHTHTHTRHRLIRLMIRPVTVSWSSILITSHWPTYGPSMKFNLNSNLQELVQCHYTFWNWNSKIMDIVTIDLRKWVLFQQKSQSIREMEASLNDEIISGNLGNFRLSFLGILREWLKILGILENAWSNQAFPRLPENFRQSRDCLEFWEWR